MSSPWTDERLTAAFGAWARLGPSAAPVDLTPRVLTAIAAEAAAASERRAWWRRLAPAVAVAVLVVAVGVVFVGPPLLADRTSARPAVTFGPGPTADLQTLTTKDFSFDFPGTWHAYDSAATSTDLTSIAVLGSHPVDPSCGDVMHVDIVCVNGRPLADGEIRVLVGAGDLLQGTLADRPNLDFGQTSRMTIDGYPAILDETLPTDADVYGADVTQHLYITHPSGPSHVVMIDLLFRGDPAGSIDQGNDARATMRSIIDSFRYDDAFTASATPTTAPSPSEALTTSGLGIMSVPTRLLSINGRPSVSNPPGQPTPTARPSVAVRDGPLRLGRLVGDAAGGHRHEDPAG